MKTELCCKKSFVVIGKLGSTDDGEGFVQRLWAEVNSHFAEVQPLAKYDDKGCLCGIWGAMSDMSGSFKPWEEGFTKGLYLAGVECQSDALPPAGWTKWVVPAYEYLTLENNSEDAFQQGIAYLGTKGLSLAGAVHEFTSPQNGKGYLYFPIRKR